MTDKTIETLMDEFGADMVGGRHNHGKEVANQILQKWRELEDNNKFLGGECDKWIEEIKSREAELAAVKAIKLKYGIALEWQCNFYCTWYNTGKPKMDGAAVAYELICEAREALKGGKED